jgi:hypothetical protein
MKPENGIEEDESQKEEAKKVISEEINENIICRIQI